MDQIIIFINNIINSAGDSVISSYDFIISNLTLDGIIKFIIIYFFIVWGAFIIWVVKDIINRTTNVFIQVISILLVIFLTPIFGLPIYLLIRPGSTLFEKYYENSEFDEQIDSTKNQDENSEEEQTENTNFSYACPGCAKKVERDFMVCPYCEEKLTKECAFCHKNLKLEWKVCPYCGNHEKKEEVKKVKIEKKKK